MKREAINKKLRDVLMKEHEAGGASAAIQRQLQDVFRVFALMRIAEEEIANLIGFEAIGQKHKIDRIQRSFGALAPTHTMTQLVDDVYRAHARELIGRAHRDEDPKPATEAEIMIAMSRGSLIAPLDTLHSALYERCFFRVFGKSVDDCEPFKEPYEGAIGELITTYRRRFRDVERKWSS